MRWSAGLWVALVVGCGARVDEGSDAAEAEARGLALKSASTIPHCLGQPTRHLQLHGNLSVGSPVYEFDPAQPLATTGFGIGFPLYASGGLPVMPWMYLGNLGGGRYGYHVLLEGSLADLGSGELLFAEDGSLLEVRETAPIRLPGRRGFEPALNGVFGTPTSEGGSGTDGVSSLTLLDEVSVDADGAPRVLGFDCPDGTHGTHAPMARTGEPLPAGLEVCPPISTRRVALRANLAADAPIVRRGRDPRVAPATFSTSFLASDATGMRGAFDLQFRKLAAREWEYRLLLQSERSLPELGRGRLSFDRGGALARVEVTQPFRFPALNGDQPIELDFGSPTSMGGSGVDGVTALHLASYLISVEQDGQLPRVAATCATDEAQRALQRMEEMPAPFSQELWLASYRPTPACAGSTTRWVTLGFLLDTRTPIADTPWDARAPQSPSDVWETVTIVDPLLRSIPLELRARRVSASGWELHLLTFTGNEPVERARLLLEANDSGILAHAEGPRSFQLELPDGRKGPPIELKIGTPLDETGLQRGVLLMAESESALYPWADGAPGSDCAAER